MVSSGIYRYVASRDELLTLLIRQQFEHLAKHVRGALEMAPESPGLRLGVLCEAMLNWSRLHHAEWDLLYGTPVPDFKVPRVPEEDDPGVAVIREILVLAAQGLPRTISGSYPMLSDATAPLVPGLTESQVQAAVFVWTGLIGLISAERRGWFGPGFEEFASVMLPGFVENAVVTLGFDSTAS